MTIMTMGALLLSHVMADDYGTDRVRVGEPVGGPHTSTPVAAR